MPPFTETSGDLQQLIFDAIPYPALVVDDDVRIQTCNAAALSLTGAHERKDLLTKRGGEAFNCLHATDAADGCGHGEACQYCVLRKSVYEVFADKKIIKRQHKLELVHNHTTQVIQALITVAPITVCARSLCAVFIEDISELVTLRTLTPICASCKKIRLQNNTWVRFEDYLRHHLQIKFEPGICPICKKKTSSLH
jgi:PAS domain-containing protein